MHFDRDPQTKEFILSGSGQLHIETVVKKLEHRYHVEVTLHPPKVPYKETLTQKVEVQGRHKKQSGGRGQFGDCKCIFEPLERGGGFEWVDKIFGGSVPQNFRPAIEKGIIEAAATGAIAGYPLVDFKVTLIDGSYHAVDSDEHSFRAADGAIWVVDGGDILPTPESGTDLRGQLVRISPRAPDGAVHLE